LVTYVNESEKLGAVVDEGVQMFRVGIMLGTYLAIVLSLSLIMAMVTLFVMAFFWYVVNQVLKRIRPMIDSVVDNEIETSRWTVEYLNFPRILRIFGNEEYATDRIRQSRNLWLTMLMRAERLRVFIEPMLESVTIIAAGTILVAGYFLAGESATSFVPKLENNPQPELFQQQLL
jgi:ABC-type multidrug transport system fused ATPase/permease subunit